MKTYKAARFGDVFVWEEDRCRSLAPRLDLANHSPTGFSWGPRSYDKCRDTTQNVGVSTAARLPEIGDINAPQSISGKIENARIAERDSITIGFKTGIAKSAGHAEKSDGAPPNEKSESLSSSSSEGAANGAGTRKTSLRFISIIKPGAGKQNQDPSGSPNSSPTLSVSRCSAQTVISTNTFPDNDGRAQLALAILADVYDDGKALRLYQRFKEMAISTVPQSGPFNMALSHVLKCVEAIEGEKTYVTESR